MRDSGVRGIDRVDPFKDFHHGLLERPDGVGEFLTEEEIAETERAAVLRATDEARGENQQADVRGAYNDFWWDRGTRVAESRRTSLIFDPRDTRGLPMRPGPYNNNFQIFQTEDHLVVLHEMIHDARIIPIDSTPGVTSPAIPQWFGTSSWDADTLVVDTKNFAEQQELPFSPQMTAAGMTLTERFTLDEGGTLNYEYTVDHPTIYSRPWSAELPLRPIAENTYEYACHEGNYGIVGILEGSRSIERR